MRLSAPSSIARSLLALATALLVAGGAPPARAENKAGGDAGELVRRAVERELETFGSDNTHWMYRSRKRTSRGWETREVVETTQGSLDRLIELNDQPLTDEQSAKEEARLERYVASPEQQRKRRQDQLEDRERSKKMLRAIPDAFLFEFDGTVDTPEGKATRVYFRPNPAYRAASRELKIYSALTGMALINDKEVRLAKLQGVLLRDVNFGWGLLGHLDRGGTFLVENSRIAAGHWETTTMEINFAGRALLFKSISMKESEYNYHFRRVPDNLTLAQALKLLRKPEIVAQKSR